MRLSSRSARSSARLALGLAVAIATTATILTAVQAATCPPQAASVGVAMGKAPPAVDAGTAASRNLRALSAAAGGPRVFPVHFYEGWPNPAAADGGAASELSAELATEQHVVEYARAGYPVLLTLHCMSADGVCAATADFTAWITQVLGRIGPSLEAVEITNEANLTLSSATSDGPSPNAVPDLVAGVKAAKLYVRQHGLATKVGFNWAFDYHLPGIIGTLGPQFWTDLENAAASDPTFLPSVDFVGEHTYPNFLSLATPVWRTTENEIDAIETARGDMASIGLPAWVPIRITEVGYPTSNATDETNQGDYYAQIFDAVDAVGASQNVSAVYAFLYQNTPSAATLNSDFGLVYPDVDAAPPASCAGPDGCLPGDPKPAYFVVEEAGARYDPRPVGCPVIH
jgi:hypothetical protein